MAANNRKRDIVRDIESHFDGAGALCIQDVARYLHLSKGTARTFCADITSFKLGQKRMFLAIDIADKIIRSSIEGDTDKSILVPTWR
ncbi:MAG: hypothetical protein ACLUDG_05200 [Butyricicoccus sp.]|nr:hypothetical protein [Butyricicoccus pullicaecorum]MBS5149717.1 hypothetical protein [Butyricicoccus pullicaecorum]